MVRRVLLVVSVVALTGLGIALSSGPAGAVTTCNGTMTGVISGGLVVHSFDNCDLEHAIVSGGIQMDGGTLNSCGSNISGGVGVAVAHEDTLLSWVNIGSLDNERACAGNFISGGVHISGLLFAHIPIDEAAASVELEGNVLSGGVVLTNNGVVEFESNIVSGGCLQRRQQRLPKLTATIAPR
jgi:hypothetical protein